MPQIFITKMIKSNTTNSMDTKSFLYVKTKWDLKHTEILLQDSETGKCYRSLITKEALNETANDLEIPVEIYHEECRRILTTQEPTAGYTYELDDNSKQLKIKKSLINYLYMDIALKETKNHYEIFDDAIELLEQQGNDLIKRTERTKDNDVFKLELQDNFRRLQEEKNHLEKSLLKKTALLLNTKKRKIAELEKRLMQYEKQAEESSLEITNQEESEEDLAGPSNINKQTRKRQVQITDSDTSTDEDERNENMQRNDDSDDDDFTADTEPMILPG
uniref:XRCC4 N-terminal domain-containing protein n=1 Tax=Glossina brevipalpis TaxID=37001 RepID=A0A1A9W7L1_9MUSC